MASSGLRARAALATRQTGMAPFWRWYLWRNVTAKRLAILLSPARIAAAILNCNSNRLNDSKDVVVVEHGLFQTIPLYAFC